MTPVSWSEAHAESASFLAVVPPASIAQDIIDLRARAGQPTIFDPHITVKAQPNLEPPELWRPAVARALSGVGPFHLALGDVGWFGQGIVYFEVGAQVVALHEKILDAVESVVPAERFEYEGANYVPHLTLGGLSRTTRLGAEVVGETLDDLQRIAVLASQKSWPAFEVSSIVEFRREQLGADYLPVATYPLDSE